MHYNTHLLYLATQGSNTRGNIAGIQTVHDRTSDLCFHDHCVEDGEFLGQ